MNLLLCLRSLTMMLAAGIQEMLLQSHRGMIEIFPAIPGEWKNVSFKRLRAQGAVLVSAVMKDGRVIEVRLQSERGGKVCLAYPFLGKEFHSSVPFEFTGCGFQFDLKTGEEVIMRTSAQ